MGREAKDIQPDDSYSWSFDDQLAAEDAGLDLSDLTEPPALDPEG